MVSIRHFVTDIAYRLTKENGNTFALHTPVSPTPLNAVLFDYQMEAVAEWYMSTPHSPYTVFPWLRLADQIDRQYFMLSERIGMVVQDIDPIESGDANEIAWWIETQGYLPILNSAVTGGHPLWSNTTNNRFRFVHDIMGHYLNRVGFDKYGEDAAYRSHRTTMPRHVWSALATETRGQNAALNYGNPIGDFKEQKCILPPDWVIL